MKLSRFRQKTGLRRLVRETTLTTDNLILPVFVCPGTGVDQPVQSMPGVSRWSVDVLVQKAHHISKAGIPAVMIFGIPQTKDALGSSSWDSDGIVQTALGALKHKVPSLVSMVDLCFCEYTDHGHCGALADDGSLDQPKTLAQLRRQALSLAEAGADVIAPSGMIDGMVAAIRDELDQRHYHDLPILSYAAKYASAFYGPFRDAADSSPSFGDRRTHQMDPANTDEALREIEADIAEGADAVMVKPAMPCLDVLRRVHESYNIPLAAYQVSGEYSMIQAAARNGWIDGDAVLMESLVSIRRAGATMILTYGAMRAAELMRESH